MSALALIREGWRTGILCGDEGDAVCGRDSIHFRGEFGCVDSDVAIDLVMVDRPGAVATWTAERLRAGTTETMLGFS